MPSIEEKTAEEVKTALLNQVPGVDARVFRAREDAITAEEGDAINVCMDEMVSRPFGDQVDDNELTLRVVIYVRGDPWETKADVHAMAMHPLIVKRNYAAAGIRLARAPRRLDQDWSADEGDATPGKRVVKYAFRFLTLSDDIAAQP